MAIREFVEERGIDIILHFTKLQNLASILERGLVTKDALDDHQHCNDEFRWDRTVAVCASVGFPNYKMFFAFRQRDVLVEWIIFAIHPQALIDLRCAFCQENAASNNVSSIPLAERTTFDALLRMYDDFGEKTRGPLLIPDDYPTHPQAEILFLDGVPLKYIRAVIVQNDAMKRRIEVQHPDMPIQVVVGPYYFNARKDFAHWRQVQ